MWAGRLLAQARNIKWHHWLAGAATVGGFNFGLLCALGKSYRWYYSDYEEKVQQFHAQYGFPTEKQRLEIFEWMAPTWDKTMGVVEKSGADLHRAELLPNASGDVLEVACGTGRCFDPLIEGGKVTSFVGLDRVQAMLDVAQPKLAALPFPARLVLGDAHTLPFPDGSFDTVICALCLCAIERPEVALAEMARVLRPGGKAFLVEPGVASLWPIRFAQEYLSLVPNLKHAWEVGWYDDRDPPRLLRGCELLDVESIQTRAMGNWYLITAKVVE